MKQPKAHFLAAMFIALPLSMPCDAASPEAYPEAYKTAVLATAAEAALATTSLVKDQTSAKFLKCDWLVNFSDRNWVLRVKGATESGELSYTITGFLWGDSTEDWLVSYSGGGIAGKGPILINGKAVWKYDSKLADHTTMNLDNIVKFGEHSTWSWMKGAEIIIGGTLGATGGVMVAGGTPAAVVLGIVGAASGAESAVFVSDVTKEFVEAVTPRSPEPPKVPPIPGKGQPLAPEKDKIVVAVSKDSVLGSGPSEGLSLFASRSLKENRSDGTLLIERR